MFRKRSIDIFKDNLFSVVILVLIAVILLGVYYINSLPSKRTADKLPLKKIEKINEKKFAVTCFDEDLGIRCKSLKIGGHCSDDFKKNLQAICSEMEVLGVSPLDKIVVDIRTYNGCDTELEKKTGCLPYFDREGKINDYGAGFIYLPASLFRNKESLRTVLIHELAHALTSKHQAKMTRIVKEFFAIYAEIQFYGGNLHSSCNGEEWNHLALRNYGGEYSFPKEKDNRPMDLLSVCRYGQLEYIIRKLHRKSPFLFLALWRELESHKDGILDVAWLKKNIIAIDREAGKISLRYFILDEADASPQLAVINNGDEHCAFVYMSMNGSEEHYSTRAGFQMEWLRNNKRMNWMSLSRAPILCYSSKKFLPGDVVYISAVGFGKNFLKIFIIP